MVLPFHYALISEHRRLSGESSMELDDSLRNVSPIRCCFLIVQQADVFLREPETALRTRQQIVYTHCRILDARPGPGVCPFVLADADDQHKPTMVVRLACIRGHTAIP